MLQPLFGFGRYQHFRNLIVPQPIGSATVDAAMKKIHQRRRYRQIAVGQFDFNAHDSASDE